MRQCVLPVAAFVLILGARAQAQTSYPMLMSAHPVAAQIGGTTEVTIKSRASMLGTFDVIVSGTGVTAEVVPPQLKAGEKPNLQALTLKFHVDAAAVPGVRDFRLATPQGASTLGQLVLVQDPIVLESAKNNTREEATPVTLPATLCGTIERNEDVDFFKFHVEAGTALCFHVRAMRLQDRIHDLQQHIDPIITLRNSMGSTLAAADNDFYGDPFLAHRFEHAGDYFLEIRDVRYQGNTYLEYCIEINDRPFVTNVFPMAVAAGTNSTLQLIGANLPDDAHCTLNTELGPGLHWLPLPLAEGSASNPAPIVVTDLPVTVELPAANDTPETAQPFTAPAGVCGHIESENDVDCFRFDAKKGEKFSFEVIARRHQSALDPQLRLLDAKGRQLSLQDDLRWGKRTFADALLENWTAPADGTYTVELRDLHLRGGAEFVYFLKVTPAEPYFELFADTDKTQLSPGLASVVFVRAERKNGFEGDIDLAVDGLPPGVAASCGRILAGQDDGCIVFEAAAETKLVASNVTIRGTAEWKAGDEAPQSLAAVAVPYQETYMPGGGRGHWPVEMHTVCVGDSADILAVKLSTHDVVLKPGESKRIDVEIERAKGFDKNVSLELLYRHLSGVYGNSLPPGVTFDEKNSSKLLGAKSSKGHITLKAAADAKPVEKQQITVMADVSLNFVMKRSYTSGPVFVTVAK